MDQIYKFLVNMGLVYSFPARLLFRVFAHTSMCEVVGYGVLLKIPSSVIWKTAQRRMVLGGSGV